MQSHLLMIDRFNEYLNDIKQAITVNDSQQLNTLINKPPLEFEQIELSRVQQEKILAEHGYRDNDGLQRFIQQHGDEALKRLHSTLSDAIKRLEKSLLVNNLLIRKNQHRVRQALHILSGHGTSKNSVTYSKEGNTDKQVNEKHSIALA